MILALEPDLFTEESSKDELYGDALYSPRSVWSAIAIGKIIVSSREFSEPVTAWAETLNDGRFDTEYRRAIVREFVKQNREQLKSGNFAATKPPTGHNIIPRSYPQGKFYPTNPTPTPAP